jgi:transposase
MYLGIDAAKAKFDAVLLIEGAKPKHKVFANTDAGFAALSQWLQQQSAQHVHACLEATGTFAEGIARYWPLRATKLVW